MDIILVVLILALIVVGVLIFLNGNSNNTKPTAVKKHEIIQQYEKELKNILNKYKNNNETKIKEKKLFCKNAIVSYQEISFLMKMNQTKLFKS